MSVFVGYDPERLALLRRAMLAADDHLRFVTARYLDEPDTSEVARTVAGLRHLLSTTWVPVVERVLLSEALSAPAAVSADGWVRTLDPSVPAIPPGLAAQVAGELSALEPTSAQLVAVLAAAARDPAAATAFRVAMAEDDRWAKLVDRVGLAHLAAAHRLVEDAGNEQLRREMALLDDAAALLALLMRGPTDGPTRGHVPWQPTALAASEPYAAALVVQHLRLDAVSLAAVTDRLLLRGHEGRADGDRHADGYRSGPNAGDLLIPLLVADPAAATAFLVRAAHHPAIVFMSAQDQQLVRQLLVTGTSPHHVTTATAGAILVPLLRWWGDARRRQVPHDGGTPDASSYLAEASSPWLLQFGRRSSEWNWSTDQADRALRTLIDDERAMDHLVAAIGSWQRAMTLTPLTRSDGRVDLEALLDLSTMFAQFHLAFRDEEVADDAQERFWLEVTLFTGALVASAAVSGGFLVSVGTDLTLDVTSATAAATLGRFGVATSAERSEQRAGARFGSRSADVAVVAVVGVVGRLIDEGRLPPRTLDQLDLPDAADCEPVAVADALAGFVASLEPLVDATTFNALTAVMTAFVNPSSARQACG